MPTEMENVVSISCGNQLTAALTESGRVHCWGNTLDGCRVPNELEGVIAIKCVYQYAVAVTCTGKVVCWGRSGSGVQSVPDSVIVKGSVCILL
jgi:alpha-tubulin suppressor-like RCC1 family protein